MTRPPTSLTQLAERMGADEGHHLELEEAKSGYDFEELVRYCVALANEVGGRKVEGVTEGRPRRFVGSQAFIPPQLRDAGAEA